MVRGVAHPSFFTRNFERFFTEFSIADLIKVFGALPVSPRNLFKLLSTKSHALLYPGGAREALHYKGEQYKVIWPDQPEFVRMAARFGATIVPFGAVGEDDIAELVLDYNDLMRIPVVNDYIRESNWDTEKVSKDIPVISKESCEDFYSPIWSIWTSPLSPAIRVLSRRPLHSSIRRSLPSSAFNRLFRRLQMPSERRIGWNYRLTPKYSSLSLYKVYHNKLVHDHLHTEMVWPPGWGLLGMGPTRKYWPVFLGYGIRDLMSLLPSIAAFGSIG
ncbi:hypothetical protein L1049_019826 [Liquidambar formosana]|uniref:Acyltransferase n=1 Tax=Liquidambar formosana TaxID=63359 RepID=A0AAP0S6X2_LIQFO